MVLRGGSVAPIPFYVVIEKIISRYHYILHSTGLATISKTRCVRLKDLTITAIAKGIIGVAMKMIRIRRKRTILILRSASVRWRCD